MHFIGNGLNTMSDHATMQCFRTLFGFRFRASFNRDEAISSGVSSAVEDEPPLSKNSAVVAF